MSNYYLWQQIPSTTVTEIFCHTIRFDGIVLDTEHGQWNPESIFQCIQVCTLSNKKCFVRVTSDQNKTLIRYCLDSGCDGVIFSTVETKDQCTNIDLQMNFPGTNFGKRGFGLTRSNRWGLSPQHKQVITIPQIETIKGVENLKQIHSSFNYDHYLIGPYDLSSSLGKPGDFNCDEFKTAMTTIQDIIGTERMAFHLPSQIDENLDKYLHIPMLFIGMDTTILVETIRKLQTTLWSKKR